jgi:DNA-binding transcriptional ArsR family regulator
MPPRSRQNPLVREFILRNVADHPGDIGSLTIKKFGLSRTAINRYMSRLIDEGLITAEGKTKARRYELKNIVEIVFKETNITRLLDEDVVWRYKLLPEIHDLNQNIVNICQYGFTEILNNVIDHSLSDDAVIIYRKNYCQISLMIIDSGVGIFNKIKKDFNLTDPRSALLELSKGKITSDKKRHSGEGIFLPQEYSIDSRSRQAIFFIKESVKKKTSGLRKLAILQHILAVHASIWKFQPTQNGRQDRFLTRIRTTI